MKPNYEIINKRTDAVIVKEGSVLIEISAQIDTETATFKTEYRNPAQVDYSARLLRYESDPLANWQPIDRYITPRAFQAAVQQLNRNLAKMRKEIKAGRKSAAYKAMKPHAARVIKHYKEDFTFSDAWTLGKDDAPARFLWIVRKCGTWIIEHNTNWTREILKSTASNGDPAEYYIVHGSNMQRISPEAAAEYTAGLPTE